MGTPKRERQKANRQQRLEDLARQARTHKRALRGTCFDPGRCVGALGVIICSRRDSAATATTTTTTIVRVAGRRPRSTRPTDSTLTARPHQPSRRSPATAVPAADDLARTTHFARRLRVASTPPDLNGHVTTTKVLHDRLDPGAAPLTVNNFVLARSPHFETHLSRAIQGSRAMSTRRARVPGRYLFPPRSFPASASYSGFDRHANSCRTTQVSQFSHHRDNGGHKQDYRCSAFHRRSRHQVQALDAPGNSTSSNGVRRSTDHLRIGQPYPIPDLRHDCPSLSPAPRGRSPCRESPTRSHRRRCAPTLPHSASSTMVCWPALRCGASIVTTSRLRSPAQPSISPPERERPTARIDHRSHMPRLPHRRSDDPAVVQTLVIASHSGFPSEPIGAAVGRRRVDGSAPRTTPTRLLMASPRRMTIMPLPRPRVAPPTSCSHDALGLFVGTAVGSMTTRVAPAAARIRRSRSSLAANGPPPCNARMPFITASVGVLS